MNIGFISTANAGSHFSLHDSNTKQSRLRKIFEKSLVARRILLFISFLGMCMLIGDGILTPAISVLSAIDGVRAPFPEVSKAWIEAVSAIILICLFLLQKFGTSRVLKRCLLIWVILTEGPFSWHFCLPYIRHLFRLMRGRQLTSSGIRTITRMDSTNSYLLKFTGLCLLWQHLQLLLPVNR